METREQQAHDEILRRCGLTPSGAWVMRNGVNNEIVQQPPCNVFNLSPGAYRPYRKTVASGETWVEVLQQMEAES